ncbi:uncharacterized protein CDAR_559901 [Caerostris darwini]|uniref:Uncharacterized protein n=1 Tax=Caerostris darwini TaxID=1538125 RepID=A0AAV4WVP8_9ARAC|nr:uncharacterized protein CDAR_559901 [Caerostris darwini]
MARLRVTNEPNRTGLVSRISFVTKSKKSLARRLVSRKTLNPLFFVFSAVYFAFHTIAAFTLIPAVKEGQGMFIIPITVMLFVDILLDFIAIIVMGIKLVKPNDLEPFLQAGIVISSILVPLLIYSILIVVSHFEEMFQQSDQVPLQKPKSRRENEETSTDSSNASTIGTIV